MVIEVYTGSYWINARGRYCFSLGYGISYTDKNGSFCLPRVMWAKFRGFRLLPQK